MADDLQISDDSYIPPRKSELCYKVGKTDWERLKRIIKRMRAKSKVWENVGFTLIGLAASDLFALLTSIYAVEPHPAAAGSIPIWVPTTMWVVFFVGVIGAIFCFLFSREEVTSSESTVQEVLEEMKTIEDKHITEPLG